MPARAGGGASAIEQVVYYHTGAAGSDILHPALSARGCREIAVLP